MSHSGRRLHRPWQTPSNGPFSIPKSRGVRRVEDLRREGYCRHEPKGLPHLGGDFATSYLTAGGRNAGVCRDGRGAALAVLIVHEFVTDKTSDKRHAKNAEDYNRFLHQLHRQGDLQWTPPMDWRAGRPTVRRFSLSRRAAPDRKRSRVSRLDNWRRFVAHCSYRREGMSEAVPRVHRFWIARDRSIDLTNPASVSRWGSCLVGPLLACGT